MSATVSKLFKELRFSFVASTLCLFLSPVVAKAPDASTSTKNSVNAPAEKTSTVKNVSQSSAVMETDAGTGPPARPPPQTGLIEARERISDLVVDLRYATENNFFHQAVYPKDARCLLAPETAERLEKVAVALRRDGFRLKVWDCYRPRRVQFEMWKLVPKRGFVADPKGGSHHNRGAAVDVTLVGLDGGAVEMPTDFDDFSRAAHHSFAGGSVISRQNRQRLRSAMEAAGFKKNAMEWWHWEILEPFKYPLLDVPL